MSSQTPPNITTFRRYQVVSHAEETANFLNSHGIHVEILDTAPAVDLTFTGGSGPITYDVSIPEADFTKAEGLMLERVNEEVSDVQSDHYLYGFSDEELQDVLLKSDEWSAFDFTLAQKILKARGKAISPEELATMKKQRMAALAQPERNTPLWILIGYVLALTGGFLGIIMGLLIWTMKKTLPNGKRVYTYTAQDRRHGKYIFFLGLLMFILLPVLYYGGIISI